MADPDASEHVESSSSAPVARTTSAASDAASDDMEDASLQDLDSASQDFVRKTTSDILNAWKSEQKIVRIVIKSNRRVLRANRETLATIKQNAELAKRLAEQAEERRILMEREMQRKLAEVTVVLSNRGWLESTCMSYIRDYRTKTPAPRATMDKAIKDTSITTVFDMHVRDLLCDPGTTSLNKASMARLKVLEDEARVLKDQTHIERALQGLWNDLSTDVHNVRYKSQHGFYIGGRYPSDAALALVLLQAQSDKKNTEVYYYYKESRGADGPSVVAKLEGGNVVRGRMGDDGVFVPA